MDEAKAAQLLGKDVWKKYPAAMLRARAISAMARAMFPDAINGVSYTPEELGSEIEIGDDGQELVRDVTPAKPIEQNEIPPVQSTFSTESKASINTAPEGPKPIVNHAIPQPTQKFFTDKDVAEYRLPFNWGAFKAGMTFEELGVSGTKQLLQNILAYRLKCDSTGKPTPPEFLTFDTISKLYLARFND
jgi:hypothetical protein